MKFPKKVNKLIYNDTFKIIATSRNQKTNQLLYIKNNPTKLPIKNIFHNKHRDLIENLHIEETQ